jgi:hypothetical protein
MTADEFFECRPGDTVRLNCELWFGNGHDKEKTVLVESTPFTVIRGHLGFYNYYLYVETEDKVPYKLQYQSLERV